MIAGRPVATRASFTAASTASAPEFDRNADHGPPGSRCAQPLVQPQPGLVVDDVLLAVEELRRLVRDRRGDPRMGVARVGDADPRRVVEVPLAVGRDQPRALAAVDDRLVIRPQTPARRSGRAGERTRRRRAAGSEIGGHGVSSASARRGGARGSCVRSTAPTATTKMIVPMTLTWTGTPTRFLA